VSSSPQDGRRTLIGVAVERSAHHVVIDRRDGPVRGNAEPTPFGRPGLDYMHEGQGEGVPPTVPSAQRPSTSRRPQILVDVTVQARPLAGAPLIVLQVEWCSRRYEAFGGRSAFTT
jgi:hypothetical protein